MSRSISRITAAVVALAASSSLLVACGGDSSDSAGGEGLLAHIEAGNVTPVSYTHLTLPTKA